MVKNLIPQPSEGRVRAMFCSYDSQPKPNLSRAGQSIFNGRLNQSSIMSNEDPELDREAKLLDMINKVQMFQIAGNRVN